MLTPATPASRLNRLMRAISPRISRSAARIGAIMVFQILVSSLVRRKYTMTARETRISTNTMATTAMALNQ